MNKKGVELTLNTIIIAIILLVVLVVILAIFTNVMGDSVRNLLGFSNCASKGGDCVPEGQCKGVGYTQIFRFGGCGYDENENAPFCCIPPKA